jgi:hypothetical protein
VLIVRLDPKIQYRYRTGGKETKEEYGERKKKKKEKRKSQVVLLTCSRRAKDKKKGSTFGWRGGKVV